MIANKKLRGSLSGLAVVAVLAAVLLAIYPAGSMATSGNDDMSTSCPSCHLAPECSTACSLPAPSFHSSEVRLTPTHKQAPFSSLHSSEALTLPKPPPRA